jgi:hypothetical protein
MRGKLRDKRETKHDRLKRESMLRRPNKRENRNLHLAQAGFENDDEYLVDDENELTNTDEQPQQ